MKNTFTYIFPENLESFIIFKKEILRLLKTITNNQETIDDLVIATNELCSNIIRHAKSKKQLFLIDIYTNKGFIYIFFIDYGCGFNTKSPPDDSNRVDFNGNARIGGWGIQLATKLVDELKYVYSDYRGTCVYIKKELNGTKTIDR